MLGIENCALKWDYDVFGCVDYPRKLAIMRDEGKSGTTDGNDRDGRSGSATGMGTEVRLLFEGPLQLYLAEVGG